MRPPCSPHQIPQEVQAVDEDWQNLNDRLKSHLTIIWSQANSLEEDRSLDETPQPLEETPRTIDPAISKTLQAYVELVQFLGSQSH